MSIQEVSTKFKGFASNTEYMLTILIIVVSCLSFYLGRVSVSERGEGIPVASDAPASAIQFQQRATSEALSTTSPSVPVALEQGKYVASKKGTKYHLPWCTGAKQITDANKIWFATKEEAENAGYAPASNCKGI